MGDKQKTAELEQRIARVVAYFEEEYNCSQSVFMAYADIYGIEPENRSQDSQFVWRRNGTVARSMRGSKRHVSDFRITIPVYQLKDRQAKNANYKAVQDVANEFKSVMGSYICADLLKIKREPQKAEASERNELYYSSLGLVNNAWHWQPKLWGKRYCFRKNKNPPSH